jgi:hypothetical protein
MSDLESLVKEKVAADLQRRISALRRDLEVLKNDHAAQGCLYSGLTLKRTLAACVSATEAQRTSVIAEYRWAIDQALFASQSWVERLVAEAAASLGPLRAECEGQIHKACALVRTPELAARLVSELEVAERSAVNDIALALRSCFAERRRGLIRCIPSLVPRLLSRIFGGGAG